MLKAISFKSSLFALSNYIYRNDYWTLNRAENDLKSKINKKITALNL